MGPTQLGLCRVLCRPALSYERLELLDDAHVGLELKTPFSDGTSHLALSFDELLQRLWALVPRPGTHRAHYHGILAPAARDRPKVVPEPDLEPCPELAESDDTPLLGFDDDSPLRKRRKTVRKLLWADLLQRVFDVDVLKCPSCGGPSAGDRGGGGDARQPRSFADEENVIATLVEAKVVKAILDALGFESAPPAVRPLRGPPDCEMVEVMW